MEKEGVLAFSFASIYALCFFLVGGSLCAAKTDFPLPSQPSDMTVDSGGGVFLAAGNQLFRLDRNLALQENVTLGSDILKISLSNDESRLVVCLSDESCDVYSASDLSGGPQLTIGGAAASPDDVALFTSPGDSFYVGSFGPIPGTTNIVFLTQHGFGNASFTQSTRESGSSFTSQTNQFARTFYRGFVQDVNTYYFVIDSSPNDVRGVRVLRMCDIAECAGVSGVCEVDALYEVELVCSGLNVVDSGICGVSLLENIAGSAVKTIVLSVCGARNRICSFGLAEIDTAMDGKYTDCSGGTGDIDLVWGGLSTTRPCSTNFKARGVCDFDPALGTSDPVSGPNRALSPFSIVTGYTDMITASLAITVEDTTSLLYVGTTNTSGNFLTMYRLTLDCITAFCTDVKFNTIPMDSAVRQLQWQDGLDYIYVATDTLVTQVPLEECSTYTDCDSCISHGNPLCGWCTVEESCSRRSQCQNATGTMRWEQNITECITIDVTPNQFVLNDQDNNVTVTVSSPGLPPLLDGESYLCHFRESGDGGVVFTTEATEVTNNTVYTCDLNGTIPTFSGVKLATDVSFISSLVEVPFGTKDNALTVYNCTTTSCSQCVETENACGWCIYNKLCSGTTDTCTNSSDAYWYRLNVTNSSSEVCPLLEPADINLDGDYVQPVMVDRDLVLNTTNLPQPISGFRYVCSLGSTELETVYVSENSLTCQVDENDIVFSSGVSGEERVSLSVLWVSDDGSSPPYPIDTRNGDQINVDLYNCMDLGTSCSLCLVANTGNGFDCGWCSNENTCDIQDLCSGATSSEQCPVPIITSFSPSSGPPTGGTIITISGTDLGVTYSDVANRVFFDGDPSVCETLEDRYVPGEQIVCVTQDFGNIETPKQVSVTVILEGPRISTTSQFSVETPTITGVDPEFGPVSGGTAIVVSGDSLRVGNIENTNITVNGIECAIQDIENVNATQIMCSSMAFDGNTSRCDVGPQECLEDLSSCSLRSVSSAVGPVVINIDGSPFSGSGVDFEFRCDPRILCASPQNTIPSGGVRLTFSGCGMDVGQRPLFVVTDNTSMPYPVETECVVTSDTSIECLMPRLDGSVSFGETLSYEIRIDGVTGPDFSNGDLQVDITVERDPEFPEGALVTTEIADVIEIKGMNLDSVDQSEINVTIGGVRCEIRGTVTAEEIFCDPPTQAPGGITEAPVVIFVGQNLNFSVGTLSYVGSDIVVTADGGGVTVSADIIVLAVVLPVVVLLALSVVVVLVGYYCYKTKAYQTYPVKQRANKDVIQLQSVEVPLSPTEVLMKTLPQDSLVSSSQLLLMDAIGQGEFGVVYRARLVKGPMPQQVAVKTLKGLFTPNDIQSMIDEILKMQAFDHPHVMSLLGVCMDAGPGISIIMPYMANGSLLNYLKNERSELVLPEDGADPDGADPDKVHPVRKLLLRMCCQIAQGMDYLTQQMFVHRDLAARNCMLDSSGNIKVADFGLGEDVYTTGYFRQSKDDPIKLPFKWMSPESIEDGVFSEKSDVWSFGVTCWEVFTAGKVPYPGVDSYALPKLLEGGMRLEKPPNAACSIDIYAIMLQCWYASPERRPSFNDLATSLSQMLESIADYMEICMNLPKPEELPVDYRYEVIDPDPAPVQSLADEREVTVPVTPPEVHEYEIPVQPNPVYGAAGDDIPMEKNPVYGVSSTTHAL